MEEQRTSLFLAQLNATQRRLLQMSVHLNPMLVALADGKYSLRESAAFADAVRTLLTDDAYRPLVVIAGTEELSETALRVMLDQHSKNIDAYLKDTADLLAVMPAQAAEAYRVFTLYAIVKVAEASRDGLFGLMGDRISHSEKKVMRKMVEILELEPDEATRKKLGM
jgi:tellurite resistance protein